MTKDPMLPERKEETLTRSRRPNIQRQRARRKMTTDGIGEQNQNLRGERNGSRHKTKQKAVEVSHARKNGHEKLLPMILAEVPK